MRALQITLFVIALTFLSTQTFRHIHTKFFSTYESVLDQYDTSVEKAIVETPDLDTLVAIYEVEKAKVEAYEANPENQVIESYDQQNIEPYKSLYQAKRGIQEWEAYDQAIKKMRFYWFCGLLSVLIGFIAYLRIDKWVGMVGFITGFSEMIFWTCPTIIGVFGPRIEFERLLNNKLIFSIISWLTLLVAWYVMKVLHKRNQS